MKEFLGYLTGGGSIPLFIACLFFFYLAAAISLGAEVKKRDKLSPNTPDKFSWRFLYYDNEIRIWVSILLGYVLVRFVRHWVFPMVIDKDNELAKVLIENNEEWQLAGSAILGVFFDRLLLLLKQAKYAGSKRIRKFFTSIGITEAEQDKIEKDE